jgi:hypothetical protein
LEIEVPSRTFLADDVIEVVLSRYNQVTVNLSIRSSNNPLRLMENIYVNNYAFQFNGIKWRLIISITLEWLYLWGKNPCDRRLGAL